MRWLLLTVLVSIVYAQYSENNAEQEQLPDAHDKTDDDSTIDRVEKVHGEANQLKAQESLDEVEGSGEEDLAKKPKYTDINSAPSTDSNSEKSKENKNIVDTTALPQDFVPSSTNSVDSSAISSPEQSSGVDSEQSTDETSKVNRSSSKEEIGNAEINNEGTPLKPPDGAGRPSNPAVNSIPLSPSSSNDNQEDSNINGPVENVGYDSPTGELFPPNPLSGASEKLNIGNVLPQSLTKSKQVDNSNSKSSEIISNSEGVGLASVEKPETEESDGRHLHENATVLRSNISGSSKSEGAIDNPYESDSHEGFIASNDMNKDGHVKATNTVSVSHEKSKELSGEGTNTGEETKNGHDSEVGNGKSGELIENMEKPKEETTEKANRGEDEDGKANTEQEQPGGGNQNGSMKRPNQEAENSSSGKDQNKEKSTEQEFDGGGNENEIIEKSKENSEKVNGEEDENKLEDTEEKHEGEENEDESEEKDKEETEEVNDTKEQNKEENTELEYGGGGNENESIAKSKQNTEKVSGEKDEIKKEDTEVKHEGEENQGEIKEKDKEKTEEVIDTKDQNKEENTEQENGGGGNENESIGKFKQNTEKVSDEKDEIKKEDAEEEHEREENHGESKGKDKEKTEEANDTKDDNKEENTEEEHPGEGHQDESMEKPREETEKSNGGKGEDQEENTEREYGVRGHESKSMEERKEKTMKPNGGNDVNKNEDTEQKHVREQDEDERKEKVREKIEEANGMKNENKEAEQEHAGKERENGSGEKFKEQTEKNGDRNDEDKVENAEQEHARKLNQKAEVNTMASMEKGEQTENLDKAEHLKSTDNGRGVENDGYGGSDMLSSDDAIKVENEKGTSNKTYVNKSSSLDESTKNNTVNIDVMKEASSKHSYALSGEGKAVDVGNDKNISEKLKNASVLSNSEVVSEERRAVPVNGVDEFPNGREDHDEKQLQTVDEEGKDDSDSVEISDTVESGTGPITKIDSASKDDEVVIEYKSTPVPEKVEATSVLSHVTLLGERTPHEALQEEKLAHGRSRVSMRDERTLKEVRKSPISLNLAGNLLEKHYQKRVSKHQHDQPTIIARPDNGLEPSGYGSNETVVDYEEDSKSAVLEKSSYGSSKSKRADKPVPSHHDILLAEKHLVTKVALRTVGISSTTKLPTTTREKWTPYQWNCDNEIDDKGKLCKGWAEGGLCTMHKATMFLFCRKTCLCVGPSV